MIEPHLSLPAKVVSAIDGDTVIVEFIIRANIRLLDNYAGEIRAKDIREQDLGLKAREKIREILLPETLILVTIPVYSNIRQSLTLNRVLGEIHKDGQNISTQLWEMGLVGKNKAELQGLIESYNADL